MALHKVTSFANNISWVPTETWLCLQYITHLYLNNKTLYFYVEDVYPPQNLWPIVPVFVSSNYSFTAAFHSDVIMVLRHVSEKKLRGVRGRVIIVTFSLNNIEVLWNSYRILDVIFIIPNGRDCSVYTWQEDNKGNINPKVLDTWRAGGLVNSVTLFETRLPEFFVGKTIKIMSNAYPLFSYPNTLDGPEDENVKIIANHFRFKLQVVKIPENMRFYQIYDNDGLLTGFLSFLQNRTVDLAYGCLFLMYEDTIYADYLPPYGGESLTWSMAAPKEKSMSSGIYTSFSATIWTINLTVTLLYTLTFVIASRSELSLQRSLLSVYRTILSQGFEFEVKRPIARALFIIHSFYSLHLVWFYQSNLLVNLFQVQYEKEITTFEEAVQYGLTVEMNKNFAYLVPDEPTGAWKDLIASGKLKKFSGADDPERVIAKGDVLLLGGLNGDRLKYQSLVPNVPLKKIARFLKEPVATFPVTIYMPPGHPLAPIMANKILQIIESGLFDSKYKFKKFVEILKGDKDLEIQRPLQIENLLIAFQGLLVFLTVSFAIFLVENINFKYFRKMTK